MKVTSIYDVIDLAKSMREKNDIRPTIVFETGEQSMVVDEMMAKALVQAKGVERYWVMFSAYVRIVPEVYRSKSIDEIWPLREQWPKVEVVSVGEFNKSGKNKVGAFKVDAAGKAIGGIFDKGNEVVEMDKKMDMASKWNAWGDE